MVKYVKLQDVLDLLNAAGLEACDAGEQEAEDRLAGFKSGVERLETINLDIRTVVDIGNKGSAVITPSGVSIASDRWSK